MKTTIKNCSAPLLYAVMQKMLHPSSDYVVLAIGSDRATGDCIGPLVGHFLARENKHIPVFGSLTSPVTALNFEHMYTCLKIKYPKRKIIAIDACISKKDDVGSIKVESGGICPAAATGKKLKRVGDISITAVVSDKKENICSIHLGLVYNMAETISSALCDALSSVTISEVLRKNKNGLLKIADLM